MASSELAPTFKNDTAENAYDVHLLVKKWGGSVVDKQMDFDPATTLHFKSHGLMNELDTGKLVADKVLPAADHTATYFSFNDYSKAVTQDYNEAQKGAVSVYNDFMDELDPGGQNLMEVVTIDGISDINNLNWEFTDRSLELAIQSARKLNEVAGGNNSMAHLIEQATLARQELADAGANAKGAAETFFNYVRPPAPGIDVGQGVDLGKYEIGGANIVDQALVNNF